MKRTGTTAARIIQIIAFGLLCLISVAVMAVVIWINLRSWLK